MCQFMQPYDIIFIKLFFFYSLQHPYTTGWRKYFEDHIELQLGNNLPEIQKMLGESQRHILNPYLKHIFISVFTLLYLYLIPF